MSSIKRLRYTPTQNAQGQTLMRPYLPIALTYGERTIELSGLLDTGADVNVLPYESGIELGAIWEQQTNRFTLSGNMAAYEARGIVLTATVDTFTPVRMAFAWVQAAHVPLILGRVNFFMEFSVCFFAFNNEFQIQSK